MSRIVLVGAGHAHVAVLADWIANTVPFTEAVLITPERMLRYSGMVPGWIAGRYTRDEGLVDIRALAKRAGVRVILDRCVGLDPERRVISTQAGERVEFDIASIDTGGVGRADMVLGQDSRILDVRPISPFVARLGDLRDALADGPARIAVVGGGAGGTELAFGLRNLAAPSARPEVILATGSKGLLPDFSPAVRAMTTEAMKRQQIAIIEQDARIVDGRVVAGDASLEPIDLIVAALGSAAPSWPRESGLACDEDGYIAVDRHQRSISHPQIFAVGDVAARQDRNVPRSGVHAVFAGPVLARNLRGLAAGRELNKSYKPRLNNLYLMSTGDGSAIASFGSLAAKGRWVAKLKNWIDRRWIEKYARLARAE